MSDEDKMERPVLVKDMFELAQAFRRQAHYIHDGMYEDDLARAFNKVRRDVITEVADLFDSTFSFDSNMSYHEHRRY